MTKVREAAEVAAKPDMTPMIDVVFLMIIFFLCIEFRTLEAKLPAFLPKDRGAGTAILCPVEQLSVRIDCVAEGSRRLEARTGRGRYRLDGHRVRWTVGPRTVDSVAALRDELARVAASPGARSPDPRTGVLELVTCVIEPAAGVRYADVTATADAVHSSGFADITFAR